MADTIFSKIMSGEIPCHRIYEDSQVMAFLDIYPLSRGHTLVIPKESAVMLHELSEESVVAIARILPKICRAVMRATGAVAYNILQSNGALANQVVMHVHFHVIPKFSEADGLGLRRNSTPLDRVEGEKIAGTIVQELMA